MFQLPRKAKEAFHDHLTRFKFEELIDVKEIEMFIFIYCFWVFLYGCLCNQKNVHNPGPESSVQLLLPESRNSSTPFNLIFVRLLMQGHAAEVKISQTYEKSFITFSLRGQLREKMLKKNKKFCLMIKN